MNLSESYKKRLRELAGVKKYDWQDPNNPEYLDAWLGVGDEDMESYYEYGLAETIPSKINEIKELKFPLRIYRGINWFKDAEPNMLGKPYSNDVEFQENMSWTESLDVAKGFGNIIYTGIVEFPDDIDLEYTVKRRILHKPLDELEIVMKDNKLIKNIEKL